MIRSSVSRALLCALLSLPFLPVRSFAGCNVFVVAGVAPTDPNGTAASGQITIAVPGSPATLQRESAMERVSDILIFDDTGIAGGNCFTQGNKFVLSYNAPLTNPTAIAAATASNFDVYDSASTSGVGLAISAKTTAGFGANTQVTNLEVNVVAQGTPATSAGGLIASPVGSALRIKNLRFDARSFTTGADVVATIFAVSGLPGGQVFRTVGRVFDSVAPGASVLQDGIGYQSSNDTLTTPGIFDYAENYSGAFRLASANASGVYGDQPTTATRVIFDLGTTLPYGVDVVFPPIMQVGGTGGLTLTLRSGGTCSGPTQCTAVYDTTANGSGTWDLKTTTAKSPNTGEDGNLPALGVFIHNPSGYGTATLKISLVPSHLVSVGDVPHQILSIPIMGSGSTVTSSGPAVSGISPTSAVAGAAATTLTVTGSNFTSSSVVQWNGAARATTFVSSTQLAAALPASDLASAGSANISVRDGTSVSNAATFSITTSPKSTSPFQYVLPHVISGNGYATRITIVNTSAQQNSVVLNFVSQSGVTLSSTTYNLAPGATQRVAMTDSERYGASAAKWATVGSQAPVLSNVWYDYIATEGSQTVANSVGFNDSTPLTDFSLPVEFEPGVSGATIGKTVGLAIANPNPVAVTATLKLVDVTGAIVGTQTVSLPAYGQTAIDMSQASGFGASLPARDFVGSITVSATSPVSAIAVEDNEGLFSAVPVGVGRAK